MPFQTKPRIIYKKNPLDKVICQLRFPAILKIDSDLPSQFQDAIRQEYPLYRETTTFQQSIAIGLKPQNQHEPIRQFINPTTPLKNHEFCSQDGISKINLTRTFISLSVDKYSTWEVFVQKLKDIYNTFFSIYAPPFYTRVGLRYIDIIDRASLGLNDVNWKDLLSPNFLGPLAILDEKEIKSFSNNYVISLDYSDKSFLNLSTSFVQKITSGETCFMADSDFHTLRRIEPSNVFEKLDFLHSGATNLIQAIISEKLHIAMEPLAHEQ